MMEGYFYILYLIYIYIYIAYLIIYSCGEHKLYLLLCNAQWWPSTNKVCTCLFSLKMQLIHTAKSIFLYTLMILKQALGRVLSLWLQPSSLSICVGSVFVTIMFEVLSSTLEGCRDHEETCCRKPTRDLNFFSPASNLIQVLAAECGPVDIIGPMQIQRLQRLNCCRNILLSTDTATCTLFLW